MQTPVIEIREAKKIFKFGNEEIILFQDLDFSCSEKDFIVLSGPSGSGKSTILSIIAGLTRVNQGSVRVFGHLLKEFDEETLSIFRSMNIGIVFQMGHQIDSLTILENVLLPVELAQREEEDYQEKAWRLLEEFSLDHRAHSLPSMISGGEYQRASFVRALILDPPLLLIDEPTANQDQKTKSVILDKLSELKRKKTLIVVTHEKDIFSFADRLLVPNINGLNEGLSWVA